MAYSCSFFFKDIFLEHFIASVLFTACGVSLVYVQLLLPVFFNGGMENSNSREKERKKETKKRQNRIKQQQQQNRKEEGR